MTDSTNISAEAAQKAGNASYLPFYENRLYPLMVKPISQQIYKGQIVNNAIYLDAAYDWQLLAIHTVGVENYWYILAGRYLVEIIDLIKRAQHNSSNSTLREHFNHDLEILFSGNYVIESFLHCSALQLIKSNLCLIEQYHRLTDNCAAKTVKQEELLDAEGRVYRAVHNHLSIEHFCGAYSFSYLLYELGVAVNENDILHTKLERIGWPAEPSAFLTIMSNQDRYCLVPFSNNTILPGKLLARPNDSLCKELSLLLERSDQLKERLRAQIQADYSPFCRVQNPTRPLNGQNYLKKYQWIIVEKPSAPSGRVKPSGPNIFSQLPNNIFSVITHFLTLSDLRRRLILLNLHHYSVAQHNKSLYNIHHKLSLAKIRPGQSFDYFVAIGLIKGINSQGTLVTHSAQQQLDQSDIQPEDAVYTETLPKFFEYLYTVEISNSNVYAYSKWQKLTSQLLRNLPHIRKLSYVDEEFSYDDVLGCFSSSFKQLHTLQLSIKQELAADFIALLAKQLPWLKNLSICYSFRQKATWEQHNINFSRANLTHIAASEHGKHFVHNLESLQLKFHDFEPESFSGINLFSNLRRLQFELDGSKASSALQLEAFYEMPSLLHLELDLFPFGHFLWRDGHNYERALDFIENSTNNITELSLKHCTEFDLIYITKLRRSLTKLKLAAPLSDKLHHYNSKNWIISAKLLGHLSSLKYLLLTLPHTEDLIEVWPILATLPNLVSLTLESSQENCDDAANIFSPGDPIMIQRSNSAQPMPSFPQLRTLDVLSADGLRFGLLFSVFYNFPAPALSEFNISSNTVMLREVVRGGDILDVNKDEKIHQKCCRILNRCNLLSNSSLSSSILLSFIHYTAQKASNKLLEFPLLLTHKTQDHGQTVAVEKFSGQNQQSQPAAQQIYDLFQGYYSENNSEDKQIWDNFLGKLYAVLKLNIIDLSRDLVSLLCSPSLERVKLEEPLSKIFSLQ
jgi:hypothetical protein